MHHARPPSPDTCTNDPASGPALDPTRCPLCGQANACAMEVARATGQVPQVCWCEGVDFSAALLARLPPAARGRACICAKCAAQDAPSALPPGAAPPD